MRFIEGSSPQKLRGGYYTLSAVAAWLCRWAIRSPKDRILEPSCGEGVFLEAAGRRAIDLGADRSTIAHQMTGIEIVADEVERARTKLGSILNLHLPRDTIQTTIFLRGGKGMTARLLMSSCYQTFPEPHRSCAMEVMVALGLTPNRLTNIWVPFVLAATACLKTGGRMALVLPAELSVPRSQRRVRYKRQYQCA